MSIASHFPTLYHCEGPGSIFLMTSLQDPKLSLLQAEEARVPLHMAHDAASWEHFLLNLLQCFGIFPVTRGPKTGPSVQDAISQVLDKAE